jgi:hypothetical protein
VDVATYVSFFFVAVVFLEDVAAFAAGFFVAVGFFAAGLLEAAGFLAAVFFVVVFREAVTPVSEAVFLAVDGRFAVVFFFAVVSAAVTPSSGPVSAGPRRRGCSAGALGERVGSPPHAGRDPIVHSSGFCA